MKWGSCSERYDLGRTGSVEGKNADAEPVLFYTQIGYGNGDFFERGELRMARYKAERRLKIYSVSGKDYRDLKPSIRLSGDWLRDLGFEVGEGIKVSCSEGRLIITLQSNKETAQSNMIEERLSDLTNGVLMVAEDVVERSAL